MTDSEKTPDAQEVLELERSAYALAFKGDDPVAGMEGLISVYLWRLHHSQDAQLLLRSRENAIRAIRKRTSSAAVLERDRELLDTALGELPDDDPVRFEMLCDVALRLSQGGKPQEALETWRRALAVSEGSSRVERAQLIRAHDLYADELKYANDYAEAYSVRQAAYELLRSGPVQNTHYRLRMEFDLLVDRIKLERYEEALAESESLLAELEEAESQVLLLADTITWRAYAAMMMSDLSRARDGFTRAFLMIAKAKGVGHASARYALKYAIKTGAAAGELKSLFAAAAVGAAGETAKDAATEAALAALQGEFDSVLAQAVSDLGGSFVNGALEGLGGGF